MPAILALLLLLMTIGPSAAASLPGGDPSDTPLLWLGVAALVGGLLGAAIVGWFARSRTIARLDALSRAADALAAGAVQHRLEPMDDPVADGINLLLDQIEQLVDGMSGVTNAVAHDLRTPLTEIRTRLEGLLRSPALSDAVAGEVEEAIGDIDRLIGVFNSLLRLAELDSGTRRSVLQPTDPVLVTVGILDLYAPLADARGLSLSPMPDGLAEGEALVMADPPLLAQAVGNLIDNAIKYTPRGGRIRVQVGRGVGTIVIRVIDNGPGIRVEELPRLMRPFQRGDGSRTSPGSGLGLSLVQSIARFHGGRLTMEDAAPGVCAVVTLASVPSRPPQH